MADTIHREAAAAALAAAKEQLDTYEKWRSAAVDEEAEHGRVSPIMMKLCYLNDWEVKWEEDRTTAERRDARKRYRANTRGDWTLEGGGRAQSSSEEDNPMGMEEEKEKMKSEQKGKEFGGSGPASSGSAVEEARAKLAAHKAAAAKAEAALKAHQDAAAKEEESTVRGINTDAEAQRHEDNIKNILRGQHDNGEAMLAMGRYIMESMSVLAAEQNAALDDARRLRHTVVTSLIALERDQENESKILGVKKKEAKIGKFHKEMLPALEKEIDRDEDLDKEVYSIAANGPLFCLKCKHQRQLKQTVGKVWEAAKKAGIDSDIAIFAGKSKIKELKEAPLQLAYNACMSDRHLKGKKEMDSSNIQRIWPHGTDESWYLVRLGRDRRSEIIEEVIAAGTTDMKEMVAKVSVGSKDLKAKMDEFKERNYNGLFEICIVMKTETQMLQTVGGKNRTKGDAKGKGKGGGDGRK